MTDIFFLFFFPHRTGLGFVTFCLKLLPAFSFSQEWPSPETEYVKLVVCLPGH